MNWTAFQKQIEEEMLRAAIFEMVVGLIALAVTCWLMYVIIKAAIRDGIKESGLVDSLARTVAARQIERETAKLPDMKAD